MKIWGLDELLGKWNSKFFYVHYFAALDEGGPSGEGVRMKVMRGGGIICSLRSSHLGNLQGAECAYKSCILGTCSMKSSTWNLLLKTLKRQSHENSTSGCFIKHLPPHDCFTTYIVFLFQILRGSSLRQPQIFLLSLKDLWQ
jgi:hypothetical protein